jgi:hypothetical protein
MPSLLRFSTVPEVPEVPASPLCRVTRTPFALMQQCPPASSNATVTLLAVEEFDVHF